MADEPTTNAKPPRRQLSDADKAASSTFAPPIRLIVGLGNPGRQYVDTPHNVGWQAVEILAQRLHASWALERRFEAEVAEATVPMPGGDSRKVALMKPQTYMNLSGRSVAPFCQKNGIAPAEVLVLSDDLHLPLGKLRIRPGGSHGGQKGLLSIIQQLGTMDFPRLRIGVKPDDIPEIRGNSSFVLGKLKPMHREAFELSQQDAADACELACSRGLNAAMNRYNQGKA